MTDINKQKSMSSGTPHRRERIYQPLERQRADIRLLQLLPSESHEDSLMCSLEPVSLKSSPDFQSLSYAWGQAEAHVSLQVGTNCLKITENLANALRVIRRHDRPVLLWVDRICINQKDVEERNHQVRIMREIFTSASMVNIWLGPAFSGVVESFRVLREMAIGRPPRKILTECTCPAAVISNLTSIFKRPWWQRLWECYQMLF